MDSLGLDQRTVIECCRSAGVIDDEAAVGGMRAAAGGDPIRAVSFAGRVSRRQVLSALGERYDLPLLPVDWLQIDQQALAKLPPALVRAPRLIPIARPDSSDLPVALADPRDRAAVELAGRSLGRRCAPYLADHRDLVQLIAPADQVIDAVTWVDDLLAEAWCYRATDIHLDPEPNGYRVRLRVDGELQEIRAGLLDRLALSAISRIKVLANLDISETRSPQDGGCRLNVVVDRRRYFDARVATIPTHLGERLCIRLLGVGVEQATLTTLGLGEKPERQLRDALSKPHGLVLVTGATGSGKSTTLYAGLRHIVRPQRNVLTIEDPVEYRLPGVGQVQVDDSGRVGFASALRSLLRHDPDVIMVGEIRDSETATLALQAATTGHLVLSTLHTNTAADAPGRLADLGCPNWLIAATLRLVINQRLVPRLCTTCRERVDDGWRAKGCPACGGRGYRGRVALFESLPIDAARQRSISAGADAPDIIHAGDDYCDLLTDGENKAAVGLVAMEHVRATAGGPA